MAPKPIIQIRHLNVTYFAGKSNEVCAVKDLSLDIFPGEYIIFFGPSGCGKSTTLYSIAGLERNITGDIIVQGRNISTMRNSELEIFHQTTIGMIFQSYYLIASLNVAQNVALPQVATRGRKRDRLAKAFELLKKFGVGEQGKKLPTELSGGQQQRVAICRALMNDPQILVADEPVGNLDSKSTEDVMNLLRHLNDVEKKTVILVTHDPSHLHHANRIYYLRDGVITGTKTNTEAERKQSIVQQASLASSLGHWARTITAGSAVERSRALEAQEVLAEVLTGMTVEEMVQIEQTVHGILGRKGAGNEKSIAHALSKPVHLGGIGMQRRRAERLGREMMIVIREIKLLRDRIHKPGRKGGITAAEAREIRRFALDSLGLHVQSPKALAALDEAVRKRIDGELDRVGIITQLRKPITKGGSGLDWRVARKITRSLEPFIVSSLPSPPPQTSAPPATT